jgi:ribosomal protein S18 acetylase RimI-like enzyme
MSPVNGFQLAQVSSPTEWAHFVSLMREYTDKDLNNPGASSVHGDMLQPQQRYGSPNGQVWLLLQNNQVVGCGAFTITAHAGMAELKRLYIRPTHRGQKASRLLTKHLTTQAQLAGFSQLVLSTWRTNTKALSLYRSLGFEPMASFKNNPDPDLVFLGLHLTALEAATPPHP